MRVLTITGEGLQMDGKPFRILSGAMHYFRIHPQQWPDRLRKLKACGLNTVETYVPWNLHEPERGKFDFSGWKNLEAYLSLAGEVGLYAIVRPSPYICSEWDFGGLPYWLLNVPGLRLRCANEPFLEAVKDYYAELLPRLEPLQSTKGGPILALQVENEYGSYGDDKKYLASLRDLYLENGIDVPLFTSDGGEKLMLDGGTLPGLWATVNFGTDTERNLDNLRRHQTEEPLMCAEFWGGQGHRWGVAPRLHSGKEAAAELRKVLAAGASVNVYMFHGGTNFGLLNGALNQAMPAQPSLYSPFVTSYDTDAPLDEAGDPTEKYHEFRKVFAEFNPAFDPSLPEPEKSPKLILGEVTLTETVPLFGCLEKVCARRYESVTPETMELLGQDYGFILYRARLRYSEARTVRLTLDEPRDLARVYADGKLRTVIHRNDADKSFELQIPREGLRLDILVENLGRTNYGSTLEDNRKGISKGVLVDYQYHFGWEIFTLPLRDLAGLEYRPVEQSQASSPTFFRGEFTVSEPLDTFLEIPFGEKGVCWINGFNLGRYWNPLGPQTDLYIPAPLLNKGSNVLEVLELGRLSEPKVFLGERTRSLSSG